MIDPEKLRELAAWYREFAENTNPSLQASRIRMAEYLEEEADRQEELLHSAQPPRTKRSAKALADA